MKVFKLQNAIKPYDWGSPFFIPELLGLENSEGGPWAELWMGVHPGGPSMVRREGEAPLALSRLIEEDPPLYLGPELAESRGGLPFLFKFLAAARPLSIQAHPSLNHAREGFERENRAGLPLAAPHRNYKDPNHKPELVCAISPFTALAGFREAGALGEFLAELFRESPGVYGEAPGLFADALARDGGEPERLRAFLEALFTLSPETLGLLGARLRETGKRRDRAEWKLAGALAEAHPRDPGMLAPFYLNLISLSPGEALYLPPGILHAYIEGFALELMANSDNVLRGGA
jgi:mannose-6-phosphate isomerase